MNKKLLTALNALLAAQHNLLADLASDQFIRGTSHPAFKAYAAQFTNTKTLLAELLTEAAPAPAPANPPAV